MNTAVTRQATAVGISDSASGTETVADCAAGETMLLAGLRAGVLLPYECASGGCGSCRAQLLEGSVTSRWPDATGLSERDRRRGNRILLCQSLPDTDCRVRLPLPDPSAGAVRPVPVRLVGVLARRTLLTGDTAQLIIHLSEPMPYLPGQFVILEFDDEVRRAYSMSRPAQAGSNAAELELLVRAKPGGAASQRIFDQLDVGARIVVEGPYGQAHAQSTNERAVACLAGGTGLAPVLAIAEHLQAQEPRRRVDVYVGARRMGDIVLADRLHRLACSGARVVVVVEHPEDPAHPILGPVRTGLALEHFVDDLPDLGEHDVYLAGPAPMIDAALRQVVRDGTAVADHVYFDRFIA